MILSFIRKFVKKLKIKTLVEYHDLNLKSDVLLLADVSENFRKTFIEYYKLDPCHYFSAPGLAWDACLKMTDISLELISDIDKYLFIEKGLRGGVSIITHRKATANNKDMKSFDEKNLLNISLILMQIIYMDGLWYKACRMEDLNG